LMNLVNIVTQYIKEIRLNDDCISILLMAASLGIFILLVSLVLLRRILLLRRRL